MYFLSDAYRLRSAIIAERDARAAAEPETASRAPGVEVCPERNTPAKRDGLPSRLNRLFSIWPFMA